MKIKAIQKLTLLDFPKHTAATIFTEGCNLRCPFCHNSSLVVDRDEIYVSEEEVLDLLEKRRGLLDGLAITGGEPLLQPDIKEFIAKVKGIGFNVKLDTNGTFPEKLKEILDDKLVDYVAIDVKSSKENYGKAVGIPGISTEKFEKTVDILKNSGIPYEFRTTIVKGIHEISDIEEICKWIGDEAPYFLQMYVDSGDILAGRDGECNLSAFSHSEAEEILKAAQKIKPNTQIRGL